MELLLKKESPSAPSTKVNGLTLKQKISIKKTTWGVKFWKPWSRECQVFVCPEDSEVTEQ